MHRNRILIVDDDAGTRTLLGLILGRRGAQVFTAADGTEGLRRLLECQPDLVLLDVTMPGMDGWQTCAMMRELSDVPIIFVSALGGSENVRRGLDSGAVDYVCKPFSPRFLTARVCAALEATVNKGMASSQNIHRTT
jgi:DNA-binding response OmpR family regulator